MLYLKNLPEISNESGLILRILLRLIKLSKRFYFRSCVIEQFCSQAEIFRSKYQPEI